MTATKRTIEDYTYGSGRDPRLAEIWAARSSRRDLPLDRRPSVHRFPLLSEKLNQLLSRHVSCEIGQPNILIRAIVRPSVRGHTESGHHLLQNMSSWPPRRFDALPPTRPVANGLVNTHKQRPCHTEATLKRLFSIHRRLPIHTNIISHDAAHTLVEITCSVGTPPGHRPDKKPSARSLRRIPAMPARQEQRTRSDDGRKQLIRGALRLPAAVIARQPRPIISGRVNLHPPVQPTSGDLKRPQKRPQMRPSTRPLMAAHGRCAGEGDGQNGETGWTTPTTAVPQSRSPRRRRCDRRAAGGGRTASICRFAPPSPRKAQLAGPRRPRDQ